MVGLLKFMATVSTDARRRPLCHQELAHHCDFSRFLLLPALFLQPPGHFVLRAFFSVASGPRTSWSVVRAGHLPVFESYFGPTRYLRGHRNCSLVLPRLVRLLVVEPIFSTETTSNRGGTPYTKALCQDPIGSIVPRLRLAARL